MMRGGHGPIRQLQDLNWGAFDHASHAPQIRSCNYNVRSSSKYKSIATDSARCIYSSTLIALLRCRYNMYMICKRSVRTVV